MILVAIRGETFMEIIIASILTQLVSSEVTVIVVVFVVQVIVVEFML